MPELREVELKLELPPEHADALLAHPAVEGFRDGAARTKRLRSIYFDTADFALQAAGVALRIRFVEGRRIQTAKAGERAAGGLFERREHETEVEVDTPQPDAIDDPELRDAVARALDGHPLAAVFETDLTRVIVDARDGADRWELALDRGEVIAGERRMEISEVELELVEGSVDRLFAVALSLAEAFPLTPGGLSKAARGYALARGERPQPDLAHELASLSRELTALGDGATHRPLVAQLEKAATDGPRPETARCLLEAGRILAAARAASEG